MKRIILGIEISGFRSLDKVKITADNINVFSGLNDVGKSNILRALNLFFNNKTDFGASLNFNADYSKLALAAAQKSNKKKQQIKIKIHFGAPSTFKSLQNKELWLEKTYDRQGNVSERSSLDGTKQKAMLTRLVNSTVQYFYIPALKGPEVLEYILGEIGERKLISEADIVDLNNKVNQNISQLSNILSESTIALKTKFELPVLVQDFWQRLNINTRYDEFEKLGEVTPSARGKNVKLREESYQISLQVRGEGVKSKFIPPLLMWIQAKEPTKQYIWGIDEPENSLEFKKAEETAALYFEKYAQKAQLFLTSHSLTFIFPDKNKTKTTLFRCSKAEFGNTSIKRLQTILEGQDRIDVADELGALEIQKEVIEEWRKRQEDYDEVKSKFNEITKPVIYVEGQIDEEYLDHTISIFGLKDYPADIQWIGYTDDNGNSIYTGSSALDQARRYLSAKQLDKVVILVYDVDCKKTTSRQGNVVTYCPGPFKDTEYISGIEHLIAFPDDFDKSKYLSQQLSGDKTVTTPNKQKIKEYVLNLSGKQKRKALKNIYDMLKMLEKSYLS